MVDDDDFTCPVGAASNFRQVIDLCHVKTHLNDGRLDVEKMNMSISMTPNRHQ